MVTFAVYARILPERREQFLEALRAYLPYVRSEHGTIQYDVCQGENDEDAFVFFESYVDEGASQAHQESAAFKTYIAQIGPYLASSPEAMRVIERAKSE